MNMMDTFTDYEQTKTTVAKLQSELESALSHLETLKKALRDELGIEAAPTTTTRNKRRTMPKRAPEDNVRIQEAKARTQAEKKGISKKEVEKLVKAAGEKAAAKAGIQYPVAEK